VETYIEMFNRCKPGPAPRNPSQLRRERISIPVNEKEQSLIQDAAAAAGKDTASWSRNILWRVAHGAVLRDPEKSVISSMPLLLENPVVYGKREQLLQDAYCRAHDLPLQTQRHEGPDYYHESVGAIEFVRERHLELKDVSRYPKFYSPDERYLIVFVDGLQPRKTAADLLNEQHIKWKVWCEK